MRQGPLILRAPFQAFPRNQPPPHRVCTPTPDGFERFLQDCVGLSCGEGLPPCARDPQAQPGATRAAEHRRAFSF
jgi:hypothetical protein